MAMVDLKSPEGTVSGYLAVPKNGKGPGVLVLHAWWGLNDFFKGLCDRRSSCQCSRRSSEQRDRTSRSTHVRVGRTGFLSKPGRTRMMVPQSGFSGNEQFHS